MNKLLFLGDSITDCDHTFDPQDLGCGYVRMLSEHFPVENLGVDGYTVSGVKRLWKLFCARQTPEVVTILVGINDIAVMKANHLSLENGLQGFISTYDALIEEIRCSTDCPIFLMEPFIFPCPAEFASWEPDVRAMSRSIQALAAKHSLTFIPLWDALQNAASSCGFPEITTDGVHLTAKGHEIIASAWLQAYKKVASL